MNTRAAVHIAKLCGAVDPSISGQTVYEAVVLGMSFELRPVYIANDDLTFINQCTHQWDEYSSGMHREPYYSVALSDSGQTFIISLDNAPVCVAEVHHALQYYVGEEFMPKEKDYLVRLFFASALDLAVHSGVIQFFTGYCNQFTEVGGIIIKADMHDETALEQAGFSAKRTANGSHTGYYYYSTSKENV
jgi:hypothetical protein